MNYSAGAGAGSGDGAGSGAGSGAGVGAGEGVGVGGGVSGGGVLPVVPPVGRVEVEVGSGASSGVRGEVGVGAGVWAGLLLGRVPEFCSSAFNWSSVTHVSPTQSSSVVTLLAKIFWMPFVMSASQEEILEVTADQKLSANDADAGVLEALLMIAFKFKSSSWIALTMTGASFG